ncbi:MAG: SpoIVB peptidase [Clostridia bacterium]|nr:SpoIVB peptidase [Clostridia bacterium]
MRKSSFFVLGALLSFAFVGVSRDVVIASADESLVYVGGMPAGFTLKTESAQIIGVCEVVTENGASSPAKDAGLKAGDRIVKIDGIRVRSISELNEIVNKSQGKTQKFQIERENECFEVCIQPLKDKISNRYKIGVLVRDSVSGIGTITYVEKDSGRFGALGHSVTMENKRELQIANGTVYHCNIVGVSKGLRGKAGELRGMFLSDQCFGVADKLCDCGIFGTISKHWNTDEMTLISASSTDATMGNAYIYSTVNGVETKRYEIEIVKVDKRNKENKNYVVKITDKELINQTGGIVQGMSGSPIIQNNKLIGAITHVFLNDPTRGYGIDVETMLKE